jgi:hypothetical protein
MMSFLDNKDVEVNMEIGVAIGSSAELVPAGKPSSSLQLFAGLEAVGITVKNAPEASFSSKFAAANERVFTAEPKTIQPSVGMKMEQSFG